MPGRDVGGQVLGVGVAAGAVLLPSVVLTGGQPVPSDPPGAPVHGAVLDPRAGRGADPEREAWFGASGLDFVRLVAARWPSSTSLDISLKAGTSCPVARVTSIA